MTSSQDEAMSVIMQWSESGTRLALVFKGLGIVITESDVRVDVVIGEISEGVRISKSGDPFELRSSLREWILSPYDLPDGRRCVKMLFGKEEGASLLLCPRPQVSC